MIDRAFCCRNWADGSRGACHVLLFDQGEHIWALALGFVTCMAPHIAHESEDAIGLGVKREKP